MAETMDPAGSVSGFDNFDCSGKALFHTLGHNNSCGNGSIES